MNTRRSPDYLAGYPPALVHQVRTLIEQGGLADAARRASFAMQRGPAPHAAR